MATLVELAGDPRRHGSGTPGGYRTSLGDRGGLNPYEVREAATAPASCAENFPGNSTGGKRFIPTLKSVISLISGFGSMSISMFLTSKTDDFRSLFDGQQIASARLLRRVASLIAVLCQRALRSNGVAQQR